MFVMAVFVLVQFSTDAAPFFGLEREQRYATMRDCEMDGRVYGRENELGGGADGDVNLAEIAMRHALLQDRR